MSITPAPAFENTPHDELGLETINRLMYQALIKAAIVADLDHVIVGLFDLGVELLIRDGNGLLESIGIDAAEECAQHLEYLAKLIRQLLPEEEGA